MLQSPAALRNEMQRRIRQGEFKLTNPDDELTILTNMRQYYENWMYFHFCTFHRVLSPQKKYQGCGDQYVSCL